MLPELARETAALLAVGDGAFLSHWTAAALWRLLPPNRDGEVHITVCGRRPHRRAGTQVHRTTLLERQDIRRVRGLPVTSPARTLLDLADRLPGRRLERALDEAVGTDCVRVSQIHDVLARANGRHGAARLAALLDDAGSSRTASGGEDEFLAMVRAAQLPEPFSNAHLHGYMVDFYWREHGLVLEMDSWRWHRSRAAFERDRRKASVLTAAGLRVLQGTWEQAQEEPLALIARIATALALGLAG